MYKLKYQVKMLSMRILNITLVFTLIFAANSINPMTVLATSDFVISDHTLISYNGIDTEVIIPDEMGITSIGQDAFLNFNNMKSVKIPEGVISIGSEAFMYCRGLTSVIIPNSLKYIGVRAFYYCASLVSVNDLSGVINIGERAFYGCGSLSTLIIQNNLEYLGICAFKGTKLTSPIIFNGVLNYVPESTTSYDIPNNVRAIGELAFANCVNLTSVTIPSSVNTIQKGAFSFCSSLTSITIPNEVGFMADEIFKNCTSLSSIILSNRIKSISYYTFSGCTSLTSIIIPDSVVSINHYAFTGCSNLIEITLPNSVDYVGTESFGYCEKLVQMTILNYNIRISNESVQGCKDITICAQVGSKGEQFALNNHFNFIAIKIEPTPTPVSTPTPDPTPSTSQIQNPFSDLASVEWAQIAIIGLNYAGVIDGYDDGTYRPDNSITRAEFTKMLVTLFDIYDSNESSAFSDVSSDEWYNSYIGSAEKAELTKGNGEGKFLPDDSITREEMFILCARAINKYILVDLVANNSEEINSYLNLFVDGNSVNEWAAVYVASIIKWGLVNGSLVENGYALYPQNPITRAEVAVVLYRIILGGSE